MLKMTDLRTAAVLLSVFCAEARSQDQAAPQPRPESPYVKRMMSLDRNSDGFLTKDELLGKMGELLKTHDGNGDGKLDRRELAQSESEAVQSRSSSKTVPGRNVRRPGRNPPRGTAGSPLDYRQILRFALTFDADRDGGLNPDELERYAKALAVRRAQARRRPPSTDQPPAAEDSKKGDKPSGTNRPKGLRDPSEGDPKNPFGS